MRTTYYLTLACDRMDLLQLESGHHLTRTAEPPFSNARLLVAEFGIAAQLLGELVEQLRPRRLFSLPPSMLIHPLERLEGGLSEIERRILTELGLGCRMRKVRLYTDEPLDNAGVLARLKD